MFSEYITDIVRLAIGIVFAESAVAKLATLRTFRRGVYEYQVLPQGIVPAFTAMVVISEPALAVAHLLGLWVKLAAVGGAALLVSFAIGITVNLKRHRTIPCYCLSDERGEIISGKALIRLSVMIMGEYVVFVTSGGAEWVTKRPIGRHPEVMAIELTWVAIILVVSFWLMRWGDVVSLISRLRTTGVPINTKRIMP